VIYFFVVPRGMCVVVAVCMKEKVMELLVVAYEGREREEQEGRVCLLICEVSVSGKMK
jgi:hypothetical protein